MSSFFLFTYAIIKYFFGDYKLELDEHNINFYADLHRVKMRAKLRADKEALKSLEINYPEISKNEDALDAFCKLLNSIQNNPSFKNELLRQYFHANNIETFKIILKPVN
jgi:SpoVK/Ycf46/Vps4 family AAA+-type ATPase